MAVFRCVFCRRVYVQRLLCRDGTMRLFEHQPVPADDVPDGQFGWVPVKTTVRGRQRVAMAPVDRVGAWGAEVPKVALAHRCPVLGAD